MSSRTAFVSGLLVPAFVLALGCSGTAPDDLAGGENLAGSRVAALSGADAVSRALEWVEVAMPYCGGPNGGADILCDGTCVRTGAAANPAWDAYRSDCSGLVSYAWGLPAPGRTTYLFAPFDTTVSVEIPGIDLQPGDALNSSGHISLFAGWVDKAAGKARIIEEYNCGKVATDHILTLSVNDTSAVFISDWSPKNYSAIRYVNMEAGGGGPAPSACGAVTAIGQCDGDMLSWCENGQVKEYNCAANGKACGWQDDAVGYNCVAGTPVTQDVGCGALTYLGKCDGETLVWCENNVVMTHNCATSGKACGWQDDAVGNNCIAAEALPSDPCGGLDYQGACDGTVLKWCENGAIQSFDCATKSKTCGFQDTTIGNNCL